MVRVHPGQPAAQAAGAAAPGRAGREPLKPARTLVLGGTRSGKSGHAEALLAGCEDVVYVATARRRAGDPEWDARIDAHRRRRSPRWTTLESSDVTAALRAGHAPVLVDDLATWLTGVLDDCAAWGAGPVPSAVGERVDDLVAAVAAYPGRVVLVSAEVGLGVVPSTPAGRLFRDELGALNATLAAACDEVLLVIAGLPIPLK